MKEKLKYKKPVFKVIELKYIDILTSSGNTEQYIKGRYYDPNDWE